MRLASHRQHLVGHLACTCFRTPVTCTPTCVGVKMGASGSRRDGGAWGARDGAASYRNSSTIIARQSILLPHLDSLHTPLKS